MENAISTIEELIETGESQVNNIIEDAQGIKDWVYDVEAYLKCNDLSNKESEDLIKKIKVHSNKLGDANTLIAFLKHVSPVVKLPPINNRKQIFVAMWFDKERDFAYEVYEKVIQDNNYSCSRIDKIEFNDLIIDKISQEINDSVALIADLTGNRGGVYYEAGIAKGLKLCNHPIKLIFTCDKKYFDDRDNKPHFDVRGDNIIVYSSAKDLAERLDKRIKETIVSV